jgi:hypothetical protein
MRSTVAAMRASSSGPTRIVSRKIPTNIAARTDAEAAGSAMRAKPRSSIVVR